jgi:3-oxoacyl-[acyl-carrier-protein] synthase II
MSDKVIRIASMGSISSMGHTSAIVRESYHSRDSFISEIQIQDRKVPVARLSRESELALNAFMQKYPIHRKADRTVHLAMYAAHQAILGSGWLSQEKTVVNIGSSRGATGLWEAYHSHFLSSSRAKPRTSPLTTLGNISSHVADMLQQDGMVIDHSVACSTGMMSIMNGIAWLRSGLCEKYISGAAEAPLTAFTIEQMESLGIYSHREGTFPCRPFDFQSSENTMVLGEGAVVCCLELSEYADLKPGDWYIHSWGNAKESSASLTAITSDGCALQNTMKQAVGKGLSPDLIVAHAPGTQQGDLAEWKAIHAVFNEFQQPITSTKWKTGHTLGASGLFGVEMGMHILQSDACHELPYLDSNSPITAKRSFLVNAIGFGGNATSLLIARKQQ